MPYIKQEDRVNVVDQGGLIFVEGATENVGNLNFAITTLLHAYVKRHGLRYQHVNAVIGVMHCAAMEFYRRVAAPYEDEKISENWDVQI